MAAQDVPREEGRQGVDVPAGGRSVADDQRGYRDTGPPAEVARGMRRDSSLDIQATEQRLGIHDGGLDLDHEQHSVHRVICQQIDPPSIAVSVEADFAAHDPAEFLELLCPERRQRGMIGVEQSIDLLALPSQVPIEMKIKRSCDRARGPNAQATGVATLQRRAHRSAHARSRGQVNEAPSAPMASRPHGKSQSPIIHAPMMKTGAYRRLTGSEDEGSPLDGLRWLMRTRPAFVRLRAGTYC